MSDQTMGNCFIGTNVTQEEINHCTTNLQLHRDVQGWVLAPRTYTPSKPHAIALLKPWK